jgi:drug/metabolite transporter (DMT)-like permease
MASAAGASAAALPLEVAPAGTTVQQNVPLRVRARQRARAIALSLFYVLCWYLFSVGLTFFNKYIFTHGCVSACTVEECRRRWSALTCVSSPSLRFPISLTLGHLACVFLAAACWRRLSTLLPNPASEAPRGAQTSCLTSRLASFRASGTTLDWGTFLRAVVPLAAASALDLGLSNVSISFISVSLYTIGKSCQIVFLLIIAMVMRVERCQALTLIIICVIAGGVITFSYGDSHGNGFNGLGFFMAILAAAMGGVRWVLIQLLVQKQGLGLAHPADSLYHAAPTMALALFPAAVFFEGVAFFQSEAIFRGGLLACLQSFMWMGFGAVLAVGLHVSEFLLIHMTSSLTMSVAGIFKECITVLLAAIILHEHLTPVKIAGLLLSLAGIAAFNYMRWTGRLSSAGSDAGHDHGARRPHRSAATMAGLREDRRIRQRSSSGSNSGEADVDVPASLANRRHGRDLRSSMDPSAANASDSDDDSEHGDSADGSARPLLAEPSVR